MNRDKSPEGTETNLFQGVVNSLDAVFLHIEQKARRQLRPGCAGIEQRRRRVCEKPLRHQIVRLNRPSDIPLVNAHRHAHKHVLDALHDRAVHPVIDKTYVMQRNRSGNQAIECLRHLRFSFSLLRILPHPSLPPPHIIHSAAVCG